MNKTAVKQAATSMRILKRASCPSLSGKSNLVYEVGLTDKQDVQLHVVANSNSGAFNTDWAALHVDSSTSPGHVPLPMTSSLCARSPALRGARRNRLTVDGDHGLPVNP